MLNKLLEICRTKQEEMRTFQKHHNMNATTLIFDNERTHLENQRSFGMLSTSMNIAVQGSFVAAVFTFGIAR